MPYQSTGTVIYRDENDNVVDPHPHIGTVREFGPVVGVVLDVMTYAPTKDGELFSDAWNHCVDKVLSANIDEARSRGYNISRTTKRVKSGDLQQCCPECPNQIGYLYSPLLDDKNKPILADDYFIDDSKLVLNYG